MQKQKTLNNLQIVFNGIKNREKDYYYGDSGYEKRQKKKKPVTESNAI